MDSIQCPKCFARQRPATAATNTTSVYAAQCVQCGHRLRFRAVPLSAAPPNSAPMSPVSFTLNGTPVTLPADTEPLMSLNEFIRAQPGHTGTKKNCGEGGCGACVVSVRDPTTSAWMSVNSCLRPVLAVDGCDVVTVEGIGNTRTGMHPIQKELCDHNGTQCGFCTPGFVMNMYALLEETGPDGTLTAEEIELAQDGQICRCTGFRPILDAFGTFATKTNDSGARLCSKTGGVCTTTDIEDLGRCASRKAAQRAEEAARQLAAAKLQSQRLPPARAVRDGVSWVVAKTLEQIYDAFSSHGSDVRLVCGNTSTGIYKNPSGSVLVDVHHVPDLLVNLWDSSIGLTFGAAVPLATLIRELTAHAPFSASYGALVEHLKKVANTPVRNVASWAGNLMLTHQHNDFPSDVYTILQGVGAQVKVGNATTGITEYSLDAFLAVDMSSSVLVSVRIPVLATGELFRSYKVMARHVNSHAYVNAAMRCGVDATAAHTVTGTPTLVFGGIGPKTVLATKTAQYLRGKSLVDNAVLQGALGVLKGELHPDSPVAASSPAYRLSLATSLFYKFVLAAVGDAADPRFRSAAVAYERAVSSGRLTYDTDPVEYPVSKAMAKMTAPQQTTGEAVYTGDEPDMPGQLFAAPVLATKAPATLGAVTLTAAQSMPGFFGYIDAKDVPGKNTLDFHEELFAETDIRYVGQCIGLVLADSERHAQDAARAVTVAYTNVGTPVLTLAEAIEKKQFFDVPLPPVTMGDVDTALKTAAHVVTGTIAEGSQYHFFMETHTCAVAPTELGGLKVVVASQFNANLQGMLSGITSIPQGNIEVVTKRCGGAYGGKITRPVLLAGACAVAANKWNRPVRAVLSINDNMKMVGKRSPFQCDYTLGLDANNKLVAVKLDYYANCGVSPGDTAGSVMMAMTACDNAYYAPNWKVTGKLCQTNTPANTATRAPGCTPAIFFIEAAMDHAAQALSVDPQTLRQLNLVKQGDMTPYKVPLDYCSVPALWTQQMQAADFAARQTAVESFNKANRWRKRGITAMPLKYGLGWAGYNTNALVNVYPDGTVVVVHGGIEVGQGINTKVAQVTAFALGCDLSLVSVRATSTDIVANAQATGGSITSELCSMCVQGACDVITARFKPIKDKMTDPTWQKVVAKAAGEGMDLSARHYIDPTSKYAFTYSSYGVCVSEAEVDVLTGEVEVTRVDILFDCGTSLNPLIDSGQCYGAFVMGLGHYLTEDIRYAADGTLITDGTWEYKPPSALDIPIVFNLDMLKDAPNPDGFLRSKASGEPPLCMSSSVLFAAKMAVMDARREAGQSDYFALNGPATVDVIQTSCNVDVSQFKIK